jgi:2,5-diketo-D-gluconate reductase B
MDMAKVGPMPQMGFGTWQRRGDAAHKTTLWALEAGYRLIDTAEGYGNEVEVGRAIAGSGLGRSAIFVTTKVAPEHLGPGEVRPAAEASIERLGLDKVDLLLVHWPAVDDAYAMEDYLGQMAAVREAGLAEHVGVSNFTKRQIDRAVEILGVDAIATNQIEIHPFMQNRPIVEHCRGLGIPLTAYSPLARGAIADDSEIESVAEAHDATPGQVALAFLMAEGHAVIPTSSRRERIAENFGATTLRLSDEEMRRLRALDRGMRIVDAEWAPEWDA